jgi:uncharacterized protein (TIGR02300 family)
LTARSRYGKARATLRFNNRKLSIFLKGTRHQMVKPEWGTKRTCPKCATRFYDLGNGDPVTCISCGTVWEPEPILKSKQPMPFDAPKALVPQKDDGDLAGADEDLDIVADDDEEPSPDDEVDLGGDDDLGVEAPTDDEER